MALNGHRTFVGFGFGAIQAGLFLYEAFRSSGFRRLVVAEVVPQAVEALRAAGGHYEVNIAHPERVERAAVGPVEVEDPRNPADRGRLVAAVAEAAELATAVPSVAHFRSAGPESLHRILAEGLRRKAREGLAPAVLYAAENHNRAAEILEEAVLGEVPAAERESVRRQVRFLNTVIGKMSGVIADPGEMRARGLAPVTPSLERAFLVEAFNRILVSSAAFAGGGPSAPSLRRGLTVFEEKTDLFPFEEAKLYGHNALHAAAAYLGALLGLSRISELREKPEVWAFLRRAALEESGEALIRKHRGVDALFTAGGFAAHADDLLSRMTNPHLGDTVERVGRDVRRKLGWDDRLIGTLRLVLEQGLTPRRFGLATAAALAALDPHLADPARPASPVLLELWGDEAPEPERARVLEEIEVGRRALGRWLGAGRSDPERAVRAAEGSSTMGSWRPPS